MDTQIFQQDDCVLLGQGAFGKVLKVTEGDQKFAVKIIPKLLIRRHGRLKQLQREVDIMKRINHQNIVKIHKYEETQDDHLIKMEFCQGKNLKQFLLSNQYTKLMNSNTPNYYPIKIALDIINALAKIRSMFISNRDIKPENIMVNLSPNGKISAKIIDFGQAKFHVNCAVSQVGTNGYMAPEVFFQNNYTHSCDDWSMGLVLYQLMNHPYDKNGSIKHLTCPFKQNFNPQAQVKLSTFYNQLIKESVSLQKIRNPQPFAYIIRNLLRYDPDQRLKLLQVTEQLIKKFQKISRYLPQNERKNQLQKLSESVILLKLCMPKLQNIRIQVQKIKICYQKILLKILGKIDYEQIVQNYAFINFFMKVYMIKQRAIFSIHEDLQEDIQYIQEQILTEFIEKKLIERLNSLFKKINNYLLRNRLTVENYLFKKNQIKDFFISKHYANDQIGIILVNFEIVNY